MNQMSTIIWLEKNVLKINNNLCILDSEGVVKKSILMLLFWLVKMLRILHAVPQNIRNLRPTIFN